MSKKNSTSIYGYLKIEVKAYLTYFFPNYLLGDELYQPKYYLLSNFRVCKYALNLLVALVVIFRGNFK